jgi:hypothetical protein
MFSTGIWLVCAKPPERARELRVAKRNSKHEVYINLKVAFAAK